MVELYERNKHRIAKLVPAASRDLCRLPLFAFCGRRKLVERLFAGSLTVVPVPTREFWLATADLASGASESAKRRLEELLPAADPTMRQAIERRLSQIAIRPEPLDASAERVLEEATREHGHDESFGAQRSLFSKQARATQILIMLNLLMFAVEIAFGGSTKMESLYRLGALFPPAVRAGEWWRLVASLFLHFGALHLAMNMIGLWVLGPFVEFALGFRRFVLAYLLAGIGSMGVVMAFASGPKGGQVTVGASGCIMGLVGATGALMLRGWLRERALSARRRLIAVLLIVGMQSLFDALVPQVSMTAHLSGVLIGFAVTMILRDKLRHTQAPPIAESSTAEPMLRD
jgi:rhomboid protease GluP